MLRIIIAGGGTGGHLFPGIAIAQEVMTKHSGNRVLFVSTGKPFEKKALSEAGFPMRRITSQSIKGQGVWNQLVAVWKIPWGVFESIWILKRFRPHLVMGVGGYTSAPLVIGAWILGIQIVLHEQNVLPGITNRILAPFAKRIYVSFENTQFKLIRRTSGNVMKKVRVTGNPVRKEIIRCAMKHSGNITTASNQKETFTVLIIGGSQGAHAVNLAVMEALSYLKEKKKFFFIHQTGSQDDVTVRNAYVRQGIPCEVKPFFNDMAGRYDKADLVVCRSGASTVAEVTALGKGVIFIPYPYASDDHQLLNAQGLTLAGAAEMIRETDLNGRLLAERVEYYASDRTKLQAMASKAKALGSLDAATVIVNDFYTLLTG